MSHRNPKAFREFRRIFGVNTYAKITAMSDWDSAHVSKMRTGIRKISASFFLRLCFEKGWSPNRMMDECGLTPDYFWGDDE